MGEPKSFFFTTQETIVNVPDFCVQNELSWCVLRQVPHAIWVHANKTELQTKHVFCGHIERY